MNNNGRRATYEVRSLKFYLFVSIFLTKPTKPLLPPTRRTITAANTANKDNKYDNSCRCTCQHANKDDRQQRLPTPTKTTAADVNKDNADGHHHHLLEMRDGGHLTNSALCLLFRGLYPLFYFS